MGVRENFTAILLIGPPGSGKGTQAKLLAEKLGFYHFITSQVAREYFETHNDPETLRQKEIYSQGKLLDPEWLFKVVKEKTEELVKNPEIKGIIYDGSPRTLYEAENLFFLLSQLIGEENIIVLEINVGEEEIKRRLGKRLICSKSSNHVFIKSEKLRPGDRCPECDGILQERDLDKEELIETRIKEYQERTKPGIDYLREKGVVITINGEQSIEDVFKEIIEKLNFL